MFEVGGVPEAAVREAFRRAHHKLPVDTKVIGREELAE
jgi:ribosomal protein L16/L10AE